MLYTVTLGYTPKERLGHPEGVTISAERTFVVEADRESTAFHAAVQELKTELLIEAANVQPWAVSYERTGDRRSDG